MRRLGFAIVATVTIPMCSQAAVSPGDDLCGYLKRFGNADFILGKDGQPVRRFAEFQWSGAWLVSGTWGCRHTPDAVAKSFCSYLIGHTNQEFSADLPMRVLRCHGYVFPAHSTDWRNWVADIRLNAGDDDRSVDLDVYLIPGSVDGVVRISAAPNNPGSDDKEPPPLKETPALATKTP